MLWGRGECAELVASLDWGQTALGPVAGWSAALRATVRDVLHSRQPMLLFWGPELIQLYNDSFVPSFGRGKHPAAMGQPARACWAEAWPVVGAQIEAVMSCGEPVWFEDALVPIERNGRMEEAFWTYSYSPAFDDDLSIAGTLVIVTETTGRVIATRRLAALAQLGASLSSATGRSDVLDALAAVVAARPDDIPFASIDGGDATRTIGIAEDMVPRADIAEAMRQDAPALELARGISAGVWPEPVITLLLHRHPAARLEVAFGVSPRLPLDDGYRSFLRQLSDQLAAALVRIDSDGQRAVVMRDLEQALRAKDEFLAMLGHELRNPLAPIAAAVEIMKGKDGDTARERATIERQLHHVMRLVDDLLDVSRITRGSVELKRRPLDVAELVGVALEIAGPSIERRGHRVLLELAEDLHVDGDDARLTQVIVNLLTNAARYTPEGGEIRILTRRAGERVVVRVADTGIGMAADLVERVFDLFVQGGRSNDGAEGGLGLGLALVKNIVALHGGTVTAASAGAGEGSEFTVELPLCRPPVADQVEPPQPQRPPTGAGKRVLIVDDNEDAAQLLGDLARMSGHEISIAHDPAAAIRAVTEFAPDVAVLDIGLPGMDGYQLAAQVRALSTSCRLVALTGYGQDRDRERAAGAGFDAHFVKPIAIRDFLRVLDGPA